MSKKIYKPELPNKPDFYDEEYFLEDPSSYNLCIKTRGADLGPKYSFMIRMAAIEPGLRLLDVGCGVGLLSIGCALLGADVEAIDSSKAAIRLAKKALGAVPKEAQAKVLFQVADVKKLPFGDDTFDRVLMIDLVEHLRPDELDEALLETKRVLKSGGFLLINTTPNRWYYNYGYRLRWLFGKMRGEDIPCNPRPESDLLRHVNEQTVFSLKKVLRKNGFKSKVWLQPYLLEQKGWFNRLLYLIFVQSWPFKLVFCNSIFALARKRKAE